MSKFAVIDRLMTFALVGAVAYVFLTRGQSVAPSADDKAAIGQTAPAVSGVAYAAAQQTLVLSLRSTCSFCTDSMPFYRKLIEERRTAAKSLLILAVSTEDVDVLTEYLARHQVAVDKVAQVDPTSWRDYLRTPTALIVDAKGMIVGRWTGRLVTQRENEVQRALGLNPALWQRLTSMN